MSALSLRSSVAALAVAAVFLLAACGGSPVGPSAPSPAARGVTVLGTVVGTSAASSGVSAFDTSTTALVVSVRENPAVAVPVAADGTFTLRGLPEGEFTLVFLRGGTEVGTLTFTGLAPNQELSLTVAVEASGVVLLEERRNGIGHGDVEVQGKVEAVIELDPAGESRFTIAGRSVVVRPGETAIREGNRARTVAEVLPGRQVHVKGVWLPADAAGQSLLAHEIKLQGDLEDGDDGDDGSADCAVSGGRAGERIELQGTVQSGSAAAFVLDVQGNRSRVPVPVDAASASFECSPASGPNAPTLEQCKARVTAGARVHVRGTLTSCSATAAAARASVVRVQN